MRPSSLLRSYWNEMPALRLLLPYSTGILFFHQCCLQEYHPVILHWSPAFILLAMIYLIAYSRWRNISLIYKWRWVTGVTIMTLFGVLGLARSAWFAPPVVSWQQQLAVHHVIVADEPVLRNNSWLVLAETAQDSTGTKQKVLLTLQTTTAQSPPVYGDELLVISRFAEFASPRNPATFNYKVWNARRQVYWQGLVKPHHWCILQHHAGSAWWCAIHQIRQYFLKRIESVVPSANERAVATAMLLGYRDFMTAEVMDAYASSGVMHVLSVSGLHVGIVFMTLELFLKKMDRRRKTRILKAGLVISVLLCYACITGLSPSVLRAVSMFSLVIVARAKRAHANTYNVLAASCLALLLYQPNLLYDVGFQLSYLAVAGIFVLHPMLYRMLPIRNKWLDKIWSLTAVALAAQLVTAPLSCYYFHRFPNYFLLSNLLIIPASDVLLMGGMLLFALSAIPGLFYPCGWLFNGFLIWLNKAVFAIEQLPLAQTSGMVLTVSECALIYASIFLLIGFFKTRNKPWCWWALGCFFIFSSIFFRNRIHQRQKEQLVIFSLPGRTLIALQQGDDAICIADTSWQALVPKMRTQTWPHWWSQGVHHLKTPVSSNHTLMMHAMPFGSVMIGHHFTIAVANQPLPRWDSVAMAPFQVDVLVVSHRPKTTLKRWLQIFQPKLVVTDGSNPGWYVQQMMKEAALMRQPFSDASKHAVWLIPGTKPHRLVAVNDWDK